MVKIIYNQTTGMARVVNGRSCKIHWTAQMLSDIKRLFPVMKNEELAGILNVSLRTMIRKARELGLQKDEQWLAQVWNHHRKLALMASRAKGHPGSFQKGNHYGQQYEFQKGHKPTEEVRRKQGETLKKWYRDNPVKARQKALKAWQTRRKKLNIKIE